MPTNNITPLENLINVLESHYEKMKNISPNDPVFLFALKVESHWLSKNFDLYYGILIGLCQYDENYDEEYKELDNLLSGFIHICLKNYKFLTQCNQIVAEKFIQDMSSSYKFNMLFDEDNIRIKNLKLRRAVKLIKNNIVKIL